MPRSPDEMFIPRCVAVITERPLIEKSLKALFESDDIVVETYGSARDFIADGRKIVWACVVLDCGDLPCEPDLKEIIPKASGNAPLILLTDAADFSRGFRHMMDAVFDMFEVPFLPPALLRSVHEAVALAEGGDPPGGVRVGADTLTERERQILEHLIRGESAKLIGKELGISPRTVEAHRTRIMTKYSARNLADLVRIAVQSADEPIRGGLG